MASEVISDYLDFRPPSRRPRHLPVDHQPVLAGRQPHRIPVGDLALQDQARERILDGALDEALQGSGAKNRVVAGLGQPGAGLLVELQGHLAGRQQGAQMVQLDIDDAVHLGAGQAVEEDDLVQAVEEFRAESLVDGGHDQVAGGAGVLTFGQRRDVLGA